MFCRGSCKLKGYIPSNQYRCPLEVISTCPDYFLDWKINDKCENGRIEYVRDTSRIYRNWACASCNTVLETPKLSLDIYSSSPLKFSESPNIVELQMKDYGIDVCCTTQGGCASLSTFGYVTEPVTGRCLPIPFITECNEEPSFRQLETISEVQLGLESFVNQCLSWPSYKISGVSIVIPIVASAGSAEGRQSVLDSLFNAAATELPKTIIKKTEWIAIEDNSTYLLCGNGSIRNPLIRTNYRTLQLYQGEAKVRCTDELLVQRVSGFPLSLNFRKRSIV